MPCYQVRTVSVTFKVGNIDLLKKALEKMGCTNINVSDNKIRFDKGYNYHEIDLDNSKMVSRNMDEKSLSTFSNSIKRTYSEVVIDEVAKKQKWLKKKLGEGRYQLQRF